MALQSIALGFTLSDNREELLCLGEGCHLYETTSMAEGQSLHPSRPEEAGSRGGGDKARRSPDKEGEKKKKKKEKAKKEEPSTEESLEEEQELRRRRRSPLKRKKKKTQATVQPNIEEGGSSSSTQWMPIAPEMGQMPMQGIPNPMAVAPMVLSNMQNMLTFLEGTAMIAMALGKRPSGMAFPSWGQAPTADVPSGFWMRNQNRQMP